MSNPALELADLLARAFDVADRNRHRGDITLGELLGEEEAPAVETVEAPRPAHPTGYTRGPGIPWHYAKGDGGGRWITIGAREGEDGKRHGGSPVYIEGGRITKGAPVLTGKRLDAIKEEAEHGTHRQQLRQEKEYQKARWGKQARASGMDPTALHALAEDIMQHDRAFVQDRKSMLQDARRKAKQLGSDLTTLKARASKGIDPAAVRALDDVAQSMADSYPEQFAGFEDDATGRLFDLLSEGNPEPMTADAAYRQAFDHLAEAPAEPAPAWDDEPVPFARQYARGGAGGLSPSARDRFIQAARASGGDPHAALAALKRAQNP